MILASYIRPFDAKQKIYVLNGKQDVEEIRLADLSTYSNTVLQLLQEYGVEELQLHGNEEICSKVTQDIQSAEMTKYKNNQLKITFKGA